MCKHRAYTLYMNKMYKKEKGGKQKMSSAKEWVTGRLGYNSENDRYGLLVSDLWEHNGFHCGEVLQVMVDEKWIDTRFEMTNGNWYLVDTPYQGNDIEYVRARIKK